MKLYTEFEVKFAMDTARCQQDLTFDEVLQHLTPIELPSEEEIRKEGSKWKAGNDEFVFRMGVNWLRYKIQGGKQ